MDKVKLYEDLKTLSNKVYHLKDNSYPIPPGWIQIRAIKRRTNGFNGTVYYYKDLYYNNDIVAIVYTGTNTKTYTDWINDIQMGVKKIPSQFVEAIDLYEWVKQNYPYANLIVTGHSLGGSIAQLVSAYTGVKGVTFNAFGTGHILKEKGYLDITSVNVENFGDAADQVFMRNFIFHPGITYVLSNELNQREIRDVVVNNEILHPFKKDHHFLDTMPPLKGGISVNINRYKWKKFKKYIDAQSLNDYKHYIETLKQKTKREKETETENIRQTIKNKIKHYTYPVRVKIRRYNGEEIEITNKPIPTNAQLVTHTTGKITGNTTEERIRCIANVLNQL